MGGPVNHTYEYDLFNRLTHAQGNYVGYNDVAPELLRQHYVLDMTYDDGHNIIAKNQQHWQGAVSSYTGGLINSEPVSTTSYNLDYEDYATGTHTAGSQGYVQPHAPRSITESPVTNYNGDPEDPRVEEKLLDYDADGNLTTIKRRSAIPITL